MFLSTMGISLPPFVLGGFLLWLLTIYFPLARLSQPIGFESVLPAFTLAAGHAAYLARLVRANLMETLDEDFVRTARAKGLRDWRILWKHAMVPSLIPTLTVLGPLAAGLLTGSFVVEYIYAIPGMGRFFISAVLDRDYPLVTAVTLVYTALLVVANLAVDLAYSLLDPRIRVGKK
jgi:ABC-type dipeptide/oligopeptide/nickel transport system permease component